MDGDLQHPPDMLPRMLDTWRDGFKIVGTQRSESEDVSVFKRVTSRVFYKVFSFLSGMPMAKGTSDFRLMDRQVVEVMKDMKDADLFLRGIAHWVGFESTTIPYQAVERFSGETKYSLFRMINFASASLISFSTIPLKLGIWTAHRSHSASNRGCEGSGTMRLLFLLATDSGYGCFYFCPFIEKPCPWLFKTYQSLARIRNQEAP